MGHKDIKIIKELFPELNEIKNEKLRNGVAEVWYRVWISSSWEKIEEVPHPLLPGVSLISHIKVVFKAVKEVAKIISEMHNIKINTDLLYAAALLHDVSILLEYERKKGKIVHSKIGELIPHGYYGAHIALEVGLPIELAHLIITHTILSPIEPKMIEGIILHYVDFCDADVIRALNKLNLFLAKIYKGKY